MFDFEVLNAIPDGVCVMDESYEVVFWNRCMERWSSYSAQVMVGKHIGCYFPSIVEPANQARLKQVLQSGVSAIFSKQLHHGLFVFQHQRHAPMPQRVTVSQIKKSAGQVFALFVVQDMSFHVDEVNRYQTLIQHYEDELKQRQVLELQNKKLVAAIEHAAEAFVIMRCTGEIEYINRAFTEQTGEHNIEIHAHTPLNYFHFFIHDTDREHIQHVARSGLVWQGRKLLAGKDGGEFFASISISPILNPTGVLSHVVVVQEDVTAQLQLEEQNRITQKQEVLATLIGGIAHDFNNQLSGMMGHLYLANREVQALPKTADRVQRVQKIVEDIADTVSQLMTFVHQGDIKQQKFPLHSFLKEFSKLAGHVVPEHTRLSLDFELGHFTCLADGDRLQQSLMNIMQNAVDAVQDTPQAEITISLKAYQYDATSLWAQRYPALRQSPYAQISIHDNGSGIEPQHLERVFDPFFTTKNMGSGLGLSVTVGNIKQINGFCDVVSDATGTTFFIWLPLESKHEPTELAQIPKQTADFWILVADDDAMVRRTCAEVLDALGYLVIQASDGEEAVAQIEKFGDQVGLMIIDMVMPRMNGSVAAGHIRENYPNVPIIFATAYDQAISIEATRQFTRSVLVSKPFTAAVMAQHIHALTT